MAIMYPKNLANYMPTPSEMLVFDALKNQLPDSFEVFYSVQWSQMHKGRLIKSEADFIVTSPDYGFLCLEVKGGDGIRIEDNIWYLLDERNGERRLSCSPYEQAEKSMYYFRKTYENECSTNYSGIFAAGAVFPFYAVTENLANREKNSTIDGNDLTDIYKKIKRIFREWGGRSFGERVYTPNQHKALVELIRKRIAISAAAGSLVRYKEQQFEVINRVQNNYIYLISNIRQFYIRGGAGTGKTWIAMKMAEEEAAIHPGEVLFICASPTLARKVRTLLSEQVDVYDSPTLFASGNRDKKYYAIFVDEAQDFSESEAKLLRTFLSDEKNSRFGIFYDDVQVLREESFGDGFGISAPPLLLRENIRNTQTIYAWASEKTNLGTDVIVNPVEGPKPVTEIIHDSMQLTCRLESLLKEYLETENLPTTSLTILTDDLTAFEKLYPDGIAKWIFVRERSEISSTEVLVSSVEDFKGLESDMIIYIHKAASQNMDYIAYTRAKYYMIELMLE